MRSWFFLAFIAISSLAANPTGEKVVHGSAAFNRTDNSLEIIQKSDTAIINWQDFSIGLNEKTIFSQLSSKSSVLNRVSSFSPSQINGLLRANGQVFLINPNGIAIGKNGLIDAHTFLASTFDISNEEFLKMSGMAFKGDSECGIINNGKIQVAKDVYLISLQIENHGDVEAGSLCAMLGGEGYILFDENNPTAAVFQKTTGKVLNTGNIAAAQVAIKAAQDIFALAVNQDGISDSTVAVIQAGKVILASDEGIVKLNQDIFSDELQLAAKKIYLEGCDIETNQFKLGNENTDSITVDDKSRILIKEHSASDFLTMAGNSMIFQGKLFVENANAKVKFIVPQNWNLSGTIEFLQNQETALLQLHFPELKITADNADFFSRQLNKSNLSIISDSWATFDLNSQLLWSAPHSFSLTASQGIELLENAHIKNSNSSKSFTAVNFICDESNNSYAGIFLDKTALIESAGGDILLTAKGGNQKNNNYGIYVLGKIKLDNARDDFAKLKLQGLARKGENNNCGIYISDGGLTAVNTHVEIKGESVGTKEFNHGVCLDNGVIFNLINSPLRIEGGSSNGSSSGIFLGSAKIVSTKNQDVSLRGSNKSSIFLSDDSIIVSDKDLMLFATDSAYLYNSFQSQQNIFIDIGKNPASKLVLKRNIDEKTLVSIFFHKEEADIHVDGQFKGNISTVGKNNTLQVPDKNNYIEINKPDGGLINHLLEFDNIQNINGSFYHDDTYLFSNEGSLSGILDAKEGSNTLVGPFAATWEITDFNAGKIGKIVSFRNIENLIAQGEGNKFLFKKNGKISGTVNGAVNGILDYSNAAARIEVDLHKISGIKTIIAPLGFANNLIAPEGLNVWKVFGEDEGEIGEVYFKNFANLCGSEQNDTFYIRKEGRLTGLLDGGKGWNQLFSEVDNSRWVVTEENAGYIENLVKFVNIHNLSGKGQNNYFVFCDEGRLAGNIDGGALPNNILDYSKVTKDAVIDLNKIKNISEIYGSQEKTTLIGKDEKTTYAITNANSGLINDNIRFYQITDLVTGAQEGTFIIGQDGSLTGKIITKNSKSQLIANNLQDNIWTIDKLNSGNLNNQLFFENIGNLKGSDKSDIFLFEKDGFITYNIDGGSSFGNRVDFSHKVGEISVELNNLKNIQKLFGNDLTTLIGPNSNNIWTISKKNQGFVNDIEFYNAVNLKGGPLADVFVFADEGYLDGVIDGGPSERALNLIDYSLCTTSIKVDLFNNRADKTRGVANIQGYVFPFASINEGVQKEQTIDIPLILDSSLPQFYYRAHSPVYLSLRHFKKYYQKNTLFNYLENRTIADSNIRSRNNTISPITLDSTALKGNQNKMYVEYERDEDGLDNENFALLKTNALERNIHQRPRSLHFNLKKYNKH